MANITHTPIARLQLEMVIPDIAGYAWRVASNTGESAGVCNVGYWLTASAARSILKKRDVRA